MPGESDPKLALRVTIDGMPPGDRGARPGTSAYVNAYGGKPRPISVKVSHSLRRGEGGGAWRAFMVARAGHIALHHGNMTIVSAITTSLVLGGWAGPGVGFLTAPSMASGWQFLGNILGVIYFIAKVYFLCVVFIWVRATLSLLRSDQLMQFAWLILIPATLGNIVLTGLIYLLLSGLGWSNLVFLVGNRSEHAEKCLW